jgi:threonine dehydrogenase-like Zn-dependent dehydrogenase
VGRVGVSEEPFPLPTRVLSEPTTCLSRIWFAGTGMDDVPDGRGVLFEVLRVVVDGTDKKINDAEYGYPPEGYDFLVTVRESFGRVLEAGPNVQGLQTR